MAESAADQAAVVRRVWGYIMLDNAEAIEYIRAKAGPALTDLENRVVEAEGKLQRVETMLRDALEKGIWHE
jgi:hypothetical protein